MFRYTHVFTYWKEIHKVKMQKVLKALSQKGTQFTVVKIEQYFLLNAIAT